MVCVRIEGMGILGADVDPEEAIALGKDEALGLLKLLEEIDLNKMLEVEGM